MTLSSEFQTRKALSRAKKLSASGRIQEAAGIYEGILRQQPHHAEARKQLARLAKKHPPAGTAAPADQAAQPSQQQLGELALFYQSGRFAEAETAARQLLARFPLAMPVHNVLGAALLRQGKADAAINQFRKATSIVPDDPDTHANLASVLHRAGRLEPALESVERSLELRPDHAPTRLNRGNLLFEMNRLDDALADFERALALAPESAEAHYGYANVLAVLDRQDDALEYYDRCIELAPALVEARVNRANSLKRLGRRDEAVEALREAIELEPDRPEAGINLGFIRTSQGRCEEAVGLVQPHLERFPGNREALSCLVGALNYCEDDNTLEGRHARLQNALRALEPARIGADPIDDDELRAYYRDCRALLDASELPLEHYPQTQIWRGEAYYQGCDRHFVVFKAFDAIPRYCFDCYKVYVEPRDVVELFKLLIVFATIDLPGDKTRKCMIETRDGIGGAYKGYIYCQGLDEARAIEKIVAAAVGRRISAQTAVTVKRGCSEYALSYPEYARLPDQSDDAMSYREQWAGHEAEADAKLTRHIYAPQTGSYNHAGLTLHDALVVENWLAYAAAIGDNSFQRLTERPLSALRVAARPPFVAPDADA